MEYGQPGVLGGGERLRAGHDTLTTPPRALALATPATRRRSETVCGDGEQAERERITTNPESASSRRAGAVHRPATLLVTVDPVSRSLRRSQPTFSATVSGFCSRTRWPAPPRARWPGDAGDRAQRGGAVCGDGERAERGRLPDRISQARTRGRCPSTRRRCWSRRSIPCRVSTAQPARRSLRR